MSTVMVHVLLPKATIASLRTTARRRRSTATETLWRALGVLGFLHEELDKGNKILLQHQNGIQEEIVLP